MKNKKFRIIISTIVLFCIIIAVSVKAVEGKKLNTRTELLSGPNVGNSIHIGNTLDMFRESDHLYCVQHRANTTNAWYKVDAYVDIVGNIATSTTLSKGKTVKRSKESIDNVVLSYICGKENYYKGYNNSNTSDDGVRMRAIHEYLKTWYSEVGFNGLRINNKWNDSGFSLNNHKGVKDRALKLINNGIDYAKNVNTTVPSYDKKNTTRTMKSIDSTTAGPFKVKYTGIIQNVFVKDSSGNNLKVSFSTDAKGKNKINAKNIKSNTNYYIHNESGKTMNRLVIQLQKSEVLNTKIWFLEREDGRASQRLIKVETSGQTTKSIPIRIYISPAIGNLTINKIDKNTGEKLSGAKFKIKTSEGWLHLKEDGSYSYKYELPTYATKFEGNKEIKNLKFGNYSIYEVEAPEGYDLADQEGYDAKNKWVYFGDATINAKTPNVQKTIPNGKEDTKISIKGYVWIDVPRTKGNDTDGVYNDGSETRVEGVKVRLISKNNKKAVTIGDKDYVTTDSNGTYVFDKLITAAQLKDYYVEFNYNGVKAEYENLPDNSESTQKINEDISKFIPVAFNSVNVNEIKANGSRAIMDEVATKDLDLSGIATTYTGTEKENIYGLGAGGNLYQKLISKDGTVLDNINLGLKKIPEPQFEVREELSYVKIGIEDYEYTYIYNNKEGDTTKTGAPRVRWQDKEAYSRDIYPSYIGEANSSEKLKVSVVYDIYVTNTTTTEIEDLYKEKDLKLTRVVNKFDSNRYELADSNWENGTDGEAIMTQNYINKQCGNGIGKEKNNNEVTFEIKFNVKNDELLRVLQNPKGIIEKYPTQVYVTGYHDYTRMDYSWKNDIKKEQDHITKEYTENAEAPYLIFKLGEERILSGNVFEDTKDSGRPGEAVGNGKYDNYEKNVDNVKVELLKEVKDGNGNTRLETSNIYPATYTEDKSSVSVITEPAETLSNNEGKYTLRGIVPGRYYLRFTYGNGKYKIIDPTNNKEVENDFATKIDNKEIDVKDYKSTIVAQDVRDIVNKNGEEWYKKLNENNKYSVAIDNLETRKKVNYPEENQTTISMDALTPKFSIPIESTSIDKIVVTEDGEKVLKESNKFESINFGIIKQPEQNVEIKKLITNVSLKDADGRALYDGNPENASNQGVAAVSDLDLDNKNDGGSNNVKAEIVDNLLHAAELTLTYEVRITNKSELNYYNRDYYYYGIVEKNKEVTLTPTEVYDYLDHTLEYVEKDSDSTRINKPTVEEDVTIEIDNENIIAKKYQLTGWKSLYSNINNNRAQEKCSDKVKIVANRAVDSNEKNNTENGENSNDEIYIVSAAQITKAMNTPDPSSGIDSDTYKNELNSDNMKVQRPANIKNAAAKAIFKITPPTGEDRQEIIIYAIAGTIALAILGVGIIMIKKIITK